MLKYGQNIQQTSIKVKIISIFSLLKSCILVPNVYQTQVFQYLQDVLTKYCTVD